MTYRQERAWEALPQSERAALEAMAQLVPQEQREQAMELAHKLAEHRMSRARKARANAASDRKARVLVGARLPRSMAQAVADYAASQGMSVYRFVRMAIDEAMW